MYLFLVIFFTSNEGLTAPIIMFILGSISLHIVYKTLRYSKTITIKSDEKIPDSSYEIIIEDKLFKFTFYKNISNYFIIII
jgi:hypothetical protein